jgi:hypothetical protein
MRAQAVFERIPDLFVDTYRGKMMDWARGGDRTCVLKLLRMPDDMAGGHHAVT